MPKELNDNTRVKKRVIVPPKKLKVTPKLPDLLWDADKVKRYKNIQNFYNNNFWGYGVFGNLIHYDPRTKEGLAAILSNLDYAKSNVRNFGENLLIAGAMEGAGQAIKWAITPVEIGSGAEAVVKSAPLSTKVTKVSIIPRSEMHLRNLVPGALKSTLVKKGNGVYTYTLPKIKILSPELLAKVGKTLEKYMNKKGWRKITHPNLQGLGFTNGRHVVSDLGPGNVGKDWLGRIRFNDFSLETVPEFRLAMQKKGGKFNFKN